MWSVWLVFYCGGFHSGCSLMDKKKRFMEASWWERLTDGKTGSCSDGQGHAQSNFNPVFCWWAGCVPSLLSGLRPNYGGGNEDNSDLLQKVLCMYCCALCPRPSNRPPLTHSSAWLLDTHGQVWVSLLWGHCSFLLGPGAHKFCVCVCVCVCVPSKCLFLGKMTVSQKKAMREVYDLSAG